MKNHTSVVEVIEDNHYESNNKENSMLKVNETSIGNMKDFNVCNESGKREKRKSPCLKGERLRVHGLDLRPSSKPPDVEVELSGFDQPAKVRSRQEPPDKPLNRSVSVDGGGYIQTSWIKPSLEPRHTLSLTGDPPATAPSLPEPRVVVCLGVAMVLMRNEQPPTIWSQTRPG
ncbi:hypothetical protein TSUD_217350 [Trifolium subterraneum]|uniref:Uncharacterized protein n=1 Tax=Trifolium subterraneum TaxID=3900 RepID=A0A2Z6NES8_TRISU|nr:hypothetical protein TSUD_217350 [Trifolium subterraneum]